MFFCRPIFWMSLCVYYAMYSDVGRLRRGTNQSPPPPPYHYLVFRGGRGEYNGTLRERAALAGQQRRFLFIDDLKQFELNVNERCELNMVRHGWTGAHLWS